MYPSSAPTRETESAGSTMFMVPTDTAEAPAMMNSSMSSREAMPPSPMTGMLHLLVNLVHDPHRQGPDGRAGQAGDPVLEVRPSLLHVDLHAQERVHRGHRVRAELLGPHRELRYVGHVGRELHDERAAASLSAPSPPGP